MKFVLVARKLRKTAGLSGTEVPELIISIPDMRAGLSPRNAVDV